ncbi:C2H2 zinc finger [Ceratobasidium sp. AG-Ba]|nr:C2H2 zinc finger [Ceratobasidium sp. AG-Ba]
MPPGSPLPRSTTTMPAEIHALLNPAGPATPAPAIDKPSLRALSEAISALDDARLAALIELLIASPASGVSERDATLNLDLEALPVRVFRRVWHFVYDPAPPRPPEPSDSQESKRVVVADVLDGPDSPVPPRWPSPDQKLPPRDPHSYDHPRRRSTYTPADAEDDELKDDDPDPPLASGSSLLPSKRKAPSSRAAAGTSPKRSVDPPTLAVTHSSHIIRRASSPSSRSDASGSAKHEYRFVQPAPHPAPVSSASASGSGTGPAQTSAAAKVQWASNRTGIPCAYRSPIPDFAQCTRTFSRVADMRRHIDHQHCEEEAQAVIDGRLARTAATLLGDDWKGKISKPTCEGCGQTFSRKDAVKRHQAETGAKIVDGACVSCPGSGNGAGTGKKRARRK